MIRHTVSFALVHPADSPEEEAFLRDAATILQGIPGVRDFAVSRQVSPKSDHRFQFAMTFDGDADTRPTTGIRHDRLVDDRWAVEVATFQELDLVPLDAP